MQQPQKPEKHDYAEAARSLLALNGLEISSEQAAEFEKEFLAEEAGRPPAQSAKPA